MPLLFDRNRSLLQARRYFLCSIVYNKAFLFCTNLPQTTCLHTRTAFFPLCHSVHTALTAFI